MRVKCAKCGAGIIEGAKACYRCGAAVPAPPPAPPAPRPAPRPQAAAPRPPAPTPLPGVVPGHAPSRLPEASLPPRGPRPLGLTVFGALALLASVVAVFAAFADTPWFLLAAVFYGLVGVGLLAGWTWSWWLAMAVACLGFLSGLVDLATGPTVLIPFVLAYHAALAANLALPNVRRYCRVGRRGEVAPVAEETTKGA